jgi:phosphoribosyl isomerase A
VTFTVLPAVDVADGRAVRLVQGAVGTETIHGSPRDSALGWQANGAEWIHLVDLDAAFGRGSNTELLAAVIGELDVNVELAGGICDEQSLEVALASRCQRVILSTVALRDPAWCSAVIRAHSSLIAVSLDVRVDADSTGQRRYRLAARGTTDAASEDTYLWETLEMLDKAGCARYIITDVSKDGKLEGPNYELYRAVIGATKTPVIASGGVSTIDDLVALAEMAAAGANLEGSIIGKALYAGHFTLPEALQAMQRFDVEGSRDSP